MNETFNPTITTIIPTYRRPNLLRRAINSVLNQTYPHFQICIYDNASGDETAKVVAEFGKKDSRVKYHCHSENIGAGKNLLYGMEHVNTQYFNILSDDDLILSRFFEEGVKAFEQFGKAIFFAGATIQVDQEGNIFGAPLDSWRNGQYSPPDGFLEMLKYGHPEWTGILFKKEVLSLVGFIDEETGAASDLDFELRISAQHPIVTTRKPCAIFVTSPVTATFKFRLSHTWPGWLKMIKNIEDLACLSPLLKKKATLILSKTLIKRVFFSGLKGALTGVPEDTLKASEVLEKEYKKSFQAGFLRLLTLDGPVSMVLRSFLKVMYVLRKYFRGIVVPFLWRMKYPEIKKHLR